MIPVPITLAVTVDPDARAPGGFHVSSINGIRLPVGNAPAPHALVQSIVEQATAALLASSKKRRAP